MSDKQEMDADDDDIEIPCQGQSVGPSQIAHQSNSNTTYMSQPQSPITAQLQTQHQPKTQSGSIPLFVWYLFVVFIASAASGKF